MKRRMNGIAAALLAGILILGGCSGTAALGNADPDPAALSSEASEKTTDAESAYTAFLKDFYQQNPSQNTNLYGMRDLDGDGVPELVLLLAGTEVKVYAFNGTVTEIGGHDFMTGTLRLLYTDHPSYPGILYFTAGGGAEHYGYITVRDHVLVNEKLWDKTLPDSEDQRAGGIVEYASDKDLIEESKTAYQENRDMEFIPLESLA